MVAQQPREVVAEYLHLDVAGAGEELLHVDLGTAERGARLGPAALEGRLQLIGGQHRPRTATASTGQRLDDHAAAPAEGSEEGASVVERDGMVEAVDHRYGHRDGRGPGAGLVAE